MNIVRANMLVDVSRVILGWVVTEVFLPRLVIKFEVSLGDAIQQPGVSHFHCTGSLAFDSIVDDSNSGCVIDMDGCRWLRMPKFS